MSRYRVVEVEDPNHLSKSVKVIVFPGPYGEKDRKRAIREVYGDMQRKRFVYYHQPIGNVISPHGILALT